MRRIMKKHIIRLTEEESDIRDEAMDKLAGGSQKKVRRASVLRNVDVDEPGSQIGKSPRQTIVSVMVRQCLSRAGLEADYSM